MPLRIRALFFVRLGNFIHKLTAKRGLSRLISENLFETAPLYPRTVGMPGTLQYHIGQIYVCFQIQSLL